MAEIKPVMLELRDGASITLRHAEARDARALVALTRAVLGSAEHMVQEAREYAVSPRDEKGWILRQREDPRGLYLVAEMAGGTLIGLADCRGEARHRRRHAVTMGLAVDAAWRGRGVGRALTHALLDWARAQPLIERVELNVHAINNQAIALYHALGFVEEGRRKGALKFSDGQYRDDVLMCAFVGGPHADR